MIRSLASWTFASALVLASASSFAADDHGHDHGDHGHDHGDHGHDHGDHGHDHGDHDHGAHDQGDVPQPTLVVLPGAELTDQVIDAGRFHFTASSDLFVTHNRLWDPNGAIEVTRASLRPLTRADAASQGSYVSFFYFPQPLSNGDAEGSVDGTIAHMTNALLAALPPVTERRANSNRLGDLPVETTQFRVATAMGELVGTIGGAQLGDGVLVVYAHVDPASGPRNRSLTELLGSFAEGPAPQPEPEPESDDHDHDDHGHDDHGH